jgi:hypothetical protein
MTIARRLPTDCPQDLLFEGVSIPFFFEAGKGWRLRKRSIHLSVDYSTGILARAPARKAALKWLEEQREGKVKLSTTNLESLVQFYLTMPRRASNSTAHNNITHLRAICRMALGRELKSIHVHEVRPSLWQEFQRKKCGGVLDLSTRRRNHVSINTAVRSAASIFKATLRPAFRRAGFHVPDDATEIEWLQELKRPPVEFDETKLLEAWAALPRGPLWMALGLARFAGLRKEEINACCGGWLAERRGRWGIVVCDRPDEGFLCKTGEPRFSVILNAEVLKAMKKCKKDDYVVDLDPSERDFWFRGTPQTWLRTYLGPRSAVAMPLHRLRGLYVDAVKALAETRLQEEAIKEASLAAGHTGTATTKAHYLSTPA